MHPYNNYVYLLLQGWFQHSNLGWLQHVAIKPHDFVSMNRAYHGIRSRNSVKDHLGLLGLPHAGA